jgi:hypothetical protein
MWIKKLKKLYDYREFKWYHLLNYIKILSYCQWKTNDGNYY